MMGSSADKPSGGSEAAAFSQRHGAGEQRLDLAQLVPEPAC
jgi:hypothetical protein